MASFLSNARNSSGVNSITQSSIADPCTSSPTTSTGRKFKCQTNETSNEYQLFPLAENCENAMKHTQKMSWHNLLKHLKSQRIVKNVEIFKSKQKYKSNVHQKFPLAQRHKKFKKDFPLTNAKHDQLRYDDVVQGRDTKWKTLKFPLKLDRKKKIFPYNNARLKGRSEKDFKDKRFKLRQLNSKLKNCCDLKRTLRKLPIDTNLKRFPSRQAHFGINKKFPLQNNTHSFPINLSKNEISFPFVNKFQNETNLFSSNCKKQFQLEPISQLLQNVKTYEEIKENQNLNIKIPCQLLSLKSVSKFPISNKFTQHEHSFNENNLGNFHKQNMSRYPKTSNSFPSLSMTQTGQEIENIDNEHVVLQVQDVQAEENPRSLAAIDENKHPPPQPARANRLDDDVKILATDISPINNTGAARPNEVGYYAEKIELLQNIIVALFEKIQNSLTTNHNNNNNNNNNNAAEDESTNAAKYDHGDDNKRFALTPPMSVTSVRNIRESNNNKEVLCNKCDLGDLCDHQVGQIVECSDVRDTSAEAVEYGVTTKEKTKNTGSFLVKSEEIVSPNSPTTRNPLNETEHTSHKDYTNNVSELLEKNNVATVNEEINVDVKYNLKFETTDIIDTHEMIANTREIATASEMTVFRLNNTEQGNTQETKSTNINDNILLNDNEINEMKYEMNRVKASLPSSVAERSMGKHDNLKAGTNSTRLSTDIHINNSNNNKLAHTLTSTRNPSGSSYDRRSSLENDNSSLASAVPKRPTLPTTHMREDGVTNLSAVSSAILNENSSNRSALNTARASNDSNSDSLAHRRPSLGALRNIQSTSLLSVDLPRCPPLPTVVSTDKTAPVNHRALSIDSSVLPERTRLRRQRRLRAQDSKDELEDPMERLNLLKARISASLSEVKGVLKQYSTEAENDDENQTTHAMNTVKSVNEIKVEEEEKKEGPITFRFVKKIRRRSLFTEDDESEQTQAVTNAEPPEEAKENHLEKQLEIKDESNNCKVKTELILPIEEPVEAKGVGKKLLTEKNELEIIKNFYTLKEDTQESVEDVPQTESEPQKMVAEPQLPEGGEQMVIQETKGAIPKHEANKMENTSIQDTAKKINRKIIVKSKEPSRRASLAAVEGSKIEPPVSLLAIPVKIQRRTSDSEAMVKKKLITDKINTSGIVEEVTPKPKILKVKRSSIKINNNSQLAMQQTKLKDADATANAKSDNFIKPIDKDDNKSIHTDKSKGVLTPKQPEAESQQQISSEIVSQTTVLLLPTQLVIDEVASSSEKTIKNSMLPPRQPQQQNKQQQHELQQQQQDQQATINSTATKFISNDLQAKGTMLENVTTVLSLPAANEANGQIKREHNVVQQEDLHDLLRQGTTIIKPSTSNKQSELKEIVKEGDQSKTKDTNNDNSNGNLESVETTTKEQQQQQLQKTPTLHQQVIGIVDGAHVKISDDANKTHEHITAKESLKEPCKDKTITSSHIEAEHHQRGEEQSITNVDATKATSSPHNSISSTSDVINKTTTATQVPSETIVEKKFEASSGNQQQNIMPELKLAPAPVQTADIRSHPELHQKKTILNKKIIRQTFTDKIKKVELDKTKTLQESQKTGINEPGSDKNQPTQAQATHEVFSKTKPTQEETGQQDSHTIEIPIQLNQEELSKESLECPEISESSTSIGSEKLTATQSPKKERKVKKKVIIKRQKRRLSVGDSFFQTGSSGEQQNAEIETLEKPIAYVTDDEAEETDEKNGEKEGRDDQQENDEKEKKPLKSCILHKEYNIGDEVLYAERFKKTQIKWRRGRVKERITSISYLLDIDGKDVSSHINYLKRFTGRKVSFGAKEYLEIDYEQLAEEEEKAERLQRRTYSIWNMV